MKDNIAFSEMMVHIPLCTHKLAKDILIVSEQNSDLINELDRHKKESIYKFIELNDLEKVENKSYDVVILPNSKLDVKIVGKLFDILKDDGLIAFASKVFSRDDNRLIDDLKLVGEKFWIAMPYKFGHQASIIASKKYHPTADLNLQRADFIDNLEYYSSEIHTASFVFPAKQHRDLTGIAKR
ncbi:class I SAM-dependent methyltransferase [Aliarcobacter trophiarum]|uniref:spermidine synthase n=1 Tax=Aliarcobacter trophiarum TaxID=708186 RepID=UPI00100C116C|nr:spermidine synthase [Aliarcobacter trophiarum]RXI26472.1 spermidine synthase [Aliarcobacter trophiarum]